MSGPHRKLALNRRTNVTHNETLRFLRLDRLESRAKTYAAIGLERNNRARLARAARLEIAAYNKARAYAGAALHGQLG